MLRGVRAMFNDDPFRAPFAVACGIHAVVPALILGLLGRIVSRHRELAADRSAALLTGSPAALASALVRLRQDMTGGGVLLVDLKLAAPRNQFYVLPVDRREPGGVRRLWASHARLSARLEQLDEMERNLQTARGQAGLILEDPEAPPPPPPRSRTGPGSAGSSRAARAG